MPAPTGRMCAGGLGLRRVAQCAPGNPVPSRTRGERSCQWRALGLNKWAVSARPHERLARYQAPGLQGMRVQGKETARHVTLASVPTVQAEAESMRKGKTSRCGHRSRGPRASKETSRIAGLLCSWRWEGRVRVEQPSIPLVPLDDPTDLFPRDSVAVVEMSAARFDTEA